MTITLPVAHPAKNVIKNIIRLYDDVLVKDLGLPGPRNKKIENLSVMEVLNKTYNGMLGIRTVGRRTVNLIKERLMELLPTEILAQTLLFNELAEPILPAPPEEEPSDLAKKIADNIAKYGLDADDEE